MDLNTKPKSNKHKLTNEEVKELLFQSQNGNKEARDFLVEQNVRLVWSVVQRFINRGYDPDDLFQIGSIGLIKSIDKFDLTYDVRFSTYAVPMIIGEIQRFIRDDGSVKVSRTLKETGNKIRRAKDALTKELGRSPSVSELAQELDLSVEEIIHAEEAARTPQSIHETVFENDGDPITLLDQISTEDTKWFEKISLEEAIQHLDERERLIVYLRYYKDQTQTEVAERLGISQVQVSRIEKKLLQEIKEYLGI
ncbi:MULTISPECIES: RNA polymerase sporulation sigma factor SigF [Oceanobacillus]|uniref:RNA polymerase sigma factor n=1 Tax=Oceanobacillus indicireducens TaxID=1004261 RepID=A0A918D1H8_9BACI|nr:MULTISPECIES: RNA polymerase sporulation sigma factor SigF [Oceanobacillus]GGN56622.1 RNA polymerase sigma-F factor [Oceanobacillus indicireducens]